MSTRVRERPELLLDVSGEVGEDLRIDTPPLIQIAPRLQVNRGPQVQRIQTLNVQVAKPLQVAVMGRVEVSHARPLIQVPVEVLTAVTARLRNALPPEGDLCCALTRYEAFNVGDAWGNWGDSVFWLGTERHLNNAVTGWMNSEYEGISGTFADGDSEFCEGPLGSVEDPDKRWEILRDAWEAVATGDGTTMHMVDGVEVTAYELMAPYGLDEESVLPMVVVADSLRPQDLEKVTDWESEVYLADYVVVSAETNDDGVHILHIAPPS